MGKSNRRQSRGAGGRSITVLREMVSFVTNNSASPNIVVDAKKAT